MIQAHRLEQNRFSFLVPLRKYPPQSWRWHLWMRFMGKWVKAAMKSKTNLSSSLEKNKNTLSLALWTSMLNGRVRIGELLPELSSSKIDLLGSSISKVILLNGLLRTVEIFTGFKILWRRLRSKFWISFSCTFPFPHSRSDRSVIKSEKQDQNNQFDSVHDIFPLILSLPFP